MGRNIGISDFAIQDAVRKCVSFLVGRIQRPSIFARLSDDGIAVGSVFCRYLLETENDMVLSTNSLSLDCDLQQSVAIVLLNSVHLSLPAGL